MAKRVNLLSTIKCTHENLNSRKLFDEFLVRFSLERQTKFWSTRFQIAMVTIRLETNMLPKKKQHLKNYRNNHGYLPREGCAKTDLPTVIRSPII